MEGQKTPAEAWDVRTTPGWLQPIGLLALGAAILYVLFGFHFVFRDRAPHYGVLAYWSMFTAGGHTNSILVAEGTWGEETRPVDLAELFPTRWESGYRFSRSSFKRNTGRLSVLGASACRRIDEATGDPPNMIDFYVVRWSKVPGSNERRNPRKDHKLAWDCRRVVRLPGGRRLRGVDPSRPYPKRVRKPDEPPEGSNGKRDEKRKR